MLHKQKFLENVRSAKRGSAPGRCGTRHEHYRVLLEDIRATDNLYFFAQKLAVGDVPESIRRGLAVAHLTDLVLHTACQCENLVRRSDAEP